MSSNYEGWFMNYEPKSLTTDPSSVPMNRDYGGWMDTDEH